MGPAPARDVFWLITLALIWGSSFAAIKVAVATMPPMTMVAVRVVIAVAILGAIMAWQGARLPRDRRSWAMGFVLGVFGLALPFFLIGWGEERVSSGLAAILMAVMPLTTMVLAHFFNEGDPLNGAKLAGVGIGFVGVVILIGPEALKGLGGELLHQLAVAGGACCYAVNATLTRNLPHGPPGTPMIGRAVMVMSCGAVISVPLALAVDGPGALVAVSADAWLAALYLGVLPTGLATLIYFYLIEARGASFFSFVNYLNPVFGVLWGALLLAEVIGLQALFALALILAGVAVASRR
ncbi:MAG: DMT family transporter [Magnetovibrio sp.]|nr:DMT family transporter [Magnetovibrio sp.]